MKEIKTMIKLGLILKTRKELVGIIFRKDDVERQLRKQIKCLEKKNRKLEYELYHLKTEGVGILE